ncbi:MAG: hypothetical protein ACRDV4_03820 [Acidimicrobiales bacterium]
MRGKWAAGIPPRNFTWIVKDQLALSERPGGSAPNHRRVRRQEEIIWLRVQGFDRVVSLLQSPHNLAAYEDGQLASSHFSVIPGVDTAEILGDLYSELDRRLGAGERVLVHQEELGDRVMGVVGGYLLWSGRLPGGAQAIAVVERLVGRQMGPLGRDLVAEVLTMSPRGSAEPELAVPDREPGAPAAADDPSRDETGSSKKRDDPEVPGGDRGEVGAQ